MHTISENNINMQPLLVQLELLSKERKGLKERLFEWIVDLSQEDFDQLCNEIISLDSFFKRYEGAMVTDNEHLIQAFKDVLLKVEFVVAMPARRYNKAFFYRWLEDISVSALQSVCWELEDCCDQAMELLNTYVVSAIKPMFAASCWRIDSSFTGNLSLIADIVKSWTHQPAARKFHNMEV